MVYNSVKNKDLELSNFLYKFFIIISILSLITSLFIPKFEFHWFHLYFTKIFLSPLPLPIIMEFLDYTSMRETGVSNPRMSQRGSFGFSCLQLYLCDFSHFSVKRPQFYFFPHANVCG